MSQPVVKPEYVNRVQELAQKTGYPPLTGTGMATSVRSPLKP